MRTCPRVPRLQKQALEPLAVWEPGTVKKLLERAKQTGSTSRRQAQNSDNFTKLSIENRISKVAKIADSCQMQQMWLPFNTGDAYH